MRSVVVVVRDCSVLAALLVATAACDGADAGRAAAPSAWPAPSAWSAPVDDRDRDCADVADFRACWGERETVAWHARPLPPLPPRSKLGWHCSGSAGERRCVDRALLAPAFECQGSRCVQLHPRLPSDGEWLCADAAGAVVCLGGEPPAGVASPRFADGWHCGDRRSNAPSPAAPGSAMARGVAHGGSRSLGRRVCVDLSPDSPDGVLAGWRCRFDYEGVAKRICERDRDVHQLADACDAARPCVDGSRCVEGVSRARGSERRCLPPRPRPSCWLDRDCDRGACRFGSCAGDER